MSNQQLQTARQLISEKRYDEARALLRMIDDPTATKWLAKLDEIAPEQTTNVEAKSASGASGRGVLFVVLSLMVVIALMIAVYGAFLRPTNTVQAASEEAIAAMISAEVNPVTRQLETLEGNVDTIMSTNLETRLDALESNIERFDSEGMNGRLNTIEANLTDIAALLAQESNQQRWEYAIMQYSQFSDFSGNENPLEFAIIDRVEYLEAFSNGCEVLDDECNMENFQGLNYYVNILGSDGWEMVSVNNTSTNHYSVEIFFKRPIG
jgi:hypothetical protein